MKFYLDEYDRKKVLGDRYADYRRGRTISGIFAVMIGAVLAVIALLTKNTIVIVAVAGLAICAAIFMYIKAPRKTFGQLVRDEKKTNGHDPYDRLSGKDGLEALIDKASKKQVENK